jgi:hypothetical protein
MSRFSVFAGFSGSVFFATSAFCAGLILAGTGVAGAAPAGAAAAEAEAKPIVIRTADGLPMEVVFAGLHQGKVNVRNTASGRVIALEFAKLDTATKEVIHAEALKIRKSVARLEGVSANVEANHSGAPLAVAPRAGMAIAVAEENNRPKTMSKGASYLRFRARLPKDVAADLPVDVTIVWATESTQKRSGKVDKNAPVPPRYSFKKETVALRLTKEDGEFYSQPWTPSGSGRLAGYLVFVTNPVTGAVLWRSGGSGDLVREYEKSKAAMR